MIQLYIIIVTSYQIRDTHSQHNICVCTVLIDMLYVTDLGPLSKGYAEFFNFVESLSVL